MDILFSTKMTFQMLSIGIVHPGCRISVWERVFQTLIAMFPSEVQRSHHKGSMSPCTTSRIQMEKLSMAFVQQQFDESHIRFFFSLLTMTWRQRRGELRVQPSANSTTWRWQPRFKKCVTVLITGRPITLPPRYIHLGTQVMETKYVRSSPKISWKAKKFSATSR